MVLHLPVCPTNEPRKAIYYESRTTSPPLCVHHLQSGNIALFFARKF